MEEKDIHSELASIRSLMERSSKFLSLSGLSGVMAGIYALIGAFIGYRIVNEKYNSLSISDSYTDNSLIYHQLILIAALVLLLSVLSGSCCLSARQRKKAKTTGIR
jgi:predicted lysophospholipase L1 biosynthesis ABC-type transport system permease subunit